MDKTFAAIEKLKEVELELHRLKNYLELMNRSVEAKHEWQGLTDEEIVKVFEHIDLQNGWLMRFYRAVEAKLREKNNV
jgi:hypothetical protein